ncbi:MAG: hypothetical protein LBF34_00220 [Puniceicoccales bacterium]|jgi:hypothetical protein|nr:hypothetical protein [Puniceicoccales bacterium]
MNKLKRIELLLGLGIATSPCGFADDASLAWSLYEVPAGKNPKSDIGLVENPCKIAAEKSSDSQAVELDPDAILEIISMISAAQMKEKVRSGLLEQLQSGEVLILKNSQTPYCIMFKDDRCLFAKNGRFLSNDILRKAKIFLIDLRLFEEIRIYIFDPEGNSIPRKMIRKAKHQICDGSKWILVAGIPIAVKCFWDLAKIAAKVGGNLAVAHPIKLSIALGGFSFYRFLTNKSTK